MNRKSSFFFLLSTILTSACRLLSPTSDPQLPTSQTLPTNSATIFYQPGLLDNNLSDPALELYGVNIQDGSVFQWQPAKSGDLALWTVAPADYHFVVQGSQSDRANRLFFVGKNGRYATYDLGQFTPVNLSPDGRYLRDITDGRLSIKRVGQASLQPVAENVRGGVAWTFNSEKFLFTTSNSGKMRLVLHETQTGKQKVVMETEASFRYLLWSPDGARFAFAVHTNDEVILYQYSADGETQLSAAPLPFAELLTLVYLPDGRSLLAMGRFAAGTQIVRLADDGSGVTPFFQTDGGIRNLQASPDGRWIVFNVDRWQTGMAFTRVPATGDLSPDSFHQAPFGVLKAEFSPDGEKIALLSGTNVPRAGINQLWVWDTVVAKPQLLVPQDSGPTNVWAERDGEEVYIGYAGVSNFVWSPDSQRLYLSAALENACHAESAFSLEVMPHTEAEIHCRYSLYEVMSDGTEFRQIGAFQTPTTVHTQSNMFWLP